ncbi:hypothetical protein L249_5195 [Ophiocordyceps polyrhachis-furcata BCC 54312]|uniref:Uncharacterized protein n=1 Tax=Ophiocordyceps polyrhachis-furcata BCC 54312 TaxID=1330021 RepID=A0A367L8W7_9HYPO|nr:hypothetical protein L249_5195 [Ophiocordyceps polyrhachis-furcata BCC 54312]
MYPLVPSWASNRAALLLSRYHHSQAFPWINFPPSHLQPQLSLAVRPIHTATALPSSQDPVYAIPASAQTVERARSSSFRKKPIASNNSNLLEADIGQPAGARATRPVLPAPTPVPQRQAKTTFKDQDDRQRILNFLTRRLNSTAKVDSAPPQLPPLFWHQVRHRQADRSLANQLSHVPPLHARWVRAHRGTKRDPLVERCAGKDTAERKCTELYRLDLGFLNLFSETLRVKMGMKVETLEPQAGRKVFPTFWSRIGGIYSSAVRQAAHISSNPLGDNGLVLHIPHQPRPNPALDMAKTCEAPLAEYIQKRGGEGMMSTPHVGKKPLHLVSAPSPSGVAASG